MADAAAEKPRPNRMSRQREKTRSRLVNAALSVMARKGADAATINDITETADVGFGSFYNHFSSKEEILTVAIEELSERIGMQIDRAIVTISDPLEALAAAIRLFISVIIAKPEWAKFIVRISMMPGYKDVGLFPRLFQDIRGAQSSGRLNIVDLETATYAVAGVILFLVVALLEGDLPTADAPERVTAMALRTLGVSEKEIALLASRPLPDTLVKASLQGLLINK
jgi:AcrR family transcriptional regulator